MNVALMTYFDEKYLPLAEISLPIMRRYCEKHGYSLIQGPYKTDPSELLTYGDKGKIEMFKQVYDSCDLVMFIDIDVIIMNSNLRIEETPTGMHTTRNLKSLFRTLPQKEYGNQIKINWNRSPFLWTYDPGGPCSGFWIARTVPDVLNMLEKVQQRAIETTNVISREFDNPHRVTIQVEPYGISDQTAMRSMMHMPPYSHVLSNCVPGKLVGHCYLYADYGWERYAHMGDYEKGDWMITFPSLPLDRRLELMKQYAEEAI